MKIILELSQKMKENFSLEKMYLSEEDKMVVDALVSLGFKAHQVKKILPKIPKNLSVEERIKKGLQMVKKFLTEINKTLTFSAKNLRIILANVNNQEPKTF
jgi:hypothetical protein